MTLDEIAQDKALDCNDGPSGEKMKRGGESSSYHRNIGTNNLEETSTGLPFNLLLKAGSTLHSDQVTLAETRKSPRTETPRPPQAACFNGSSSS